MNDWLTLQMFLATFVGLGTICVLKFVETFMALKGHGSFRKDLTRVERLATDGLYVMLAGFMSMLVMHYVMDGEVEGWQYESIVTSTKVDPQTLVELKNAMSDGIMTEAEYHEIDYDTAERSRTRQFNEARDSAKAVAQ